MALPLVGSISMDNIRAELGVPSQPDFDINTARSSGYVAINQNSPYLPPQSVYTQVSLGDWRGYCQSCGTYYFSNNPLYADRCLNNDPITLISSNYPIGVGSIIYLGDYSQAYAGYWSNGTNWYLGTDTDGTTTITDTGNCSSPSYGVYTADEYYCDGLTCTFSMSDVLVAFALPFTPNYGKFYSLQAGGFYYILSAESTGPGAICDATPNFTNCNSWCFV